MKKCVSSLSCFFFSMDVEEVLMKPMMSQESFFKFQKVEKATTRHIQPLLACSLAGYPTGSYKWLGVLV